MSIPRARKALPNCGVVLSRMEALDIEAKCTKSPHWFLVYVAADDQAHVLYACPMHLHKQALEARRLSHHKTVRVSNVEDIE